jgi:hypothetical protein
MYSFQVTKSVISLLKYYDWMKFSIISEVTLWTVAQSLEKEAIKNNMTVNHMKKIEDWFMCCTLNALCCQRGPFWFNLVQETKNHTRSMFKFIII